MYEVKTRVIHDTGGQFSQGDVTNRPCSTILTKSNHYQVEYYLTDTPPAMSNKKQNQSEKPEYKIPSMEEIRTIPWNGFNAISTFSGCGGSSLGYRMAGFKMLYANEFIEAARDSYNANKADYTFLDHRDIREVSGNDIMNAIGLGYGEIDLFDGSPPCASFSTAGSRQGGWGKVKKYSDTEQRTDDLFFEFARLIKETGPKTFVAENVSGLIKGAAKGYFLNILTELKNAGYLVSAKVLDAKWLGVPQSRQRLIFVGVREDLKLKPAHPKPLSYFYTVREAIPWITQVKVGGKPDDWRSSERASGTIVQSDSGTSPTAYLSCGGFVEAETDISKYAIGDEWEKLKPGEGSKKYLNLKKGPLDNASQTVTASGGSSSTASVTHPLEKRKFTIPELKRICGFPDDFELTGTFEQRWERLGRAVPPVMMMHIAKTVRDEILRKI